MEGVGTLGMKGSVPIRRDTFCAEGLGHAKFLASRRSDGERAGDYAFSRATRRGGESSGAKRI